MNPWYSEKDRVNEEFTCRLQKKGNTRLSVPKRQGLKWTEQIDSISTMMSSRNGLRALNKSTDFEIKKINKPVKKPIITPRMNTDMERHPSLMRNS